MNNKQLIELIDVVSYEKGIPVDVVRSAMEYAVSALLRKNARPEDALFKTQIDDKGNISCWRKYTFVNVVNNADQEMIADKNNPAGSEMMVEVPEPKWTRQGLQIVRQTLLYRLKAGVRQNLVDKYVHEVGSLSDAVVLKTIRNGYIVELPDGSEATLVGKNRVPKEQLKVGQRIKVVIHATNQQLKSAAIEVSRNGTKIVEHLLSKEIPEINSGMITVHGIARDAGFKTKVAVSAHHSLKNSARNTCIGMRGIRANAITQMLGGERLEFIEFSENPAEFIISALSPGKIESMTIDEATRTIDVSAKNDEVRHVIGMSGSNVNLASKLTGWNIHVMDENAFKERRESEFNKAVSDFMVALDVDDELANSLVKAGFFSVDELAFAEIEELLVIDGFDKEIATEIMERAKQHVMLAEIETFMNESELLKLTNISEDDVKVLEGQGIDTLEKLADCAIMDVVWDEARDMQLGEWIIEARTLTNQI